MAMRCTSSTLKSEAVVWGGGAVERIFLSIYLHIYR